MTLSFHRDFLPLTADPSRRDETYDEVAPCPALRPYLRCFWGSRDAFAPSRAGLYRNRKLIPDLCADLIIQTGADAGTHSVWMTGIDTAPQLLGEWEAGEYSIFGVRFYFWALPCFMGVTQEAPDFLGLQRFLDGHAFAAAPFPARIALLERWLLGLLDPHRADSDLLNAIDRLIGTRGNQKISDLTGHCAVSSRRLERLFLRQTGLSPKQAASLLRYQSLWRAALFRPGFSTLDAVEEFGFYDQAHLLNSFRKYHGAPLHAALAHAGRGASDFYKTGTDGS